MRESVITFEEEPVTEAEMAPRIADVVQRYPLGRWVNLGYWQRVLRGPIS